MALQETSQALSKQIVECEERLARAQTDLRIERDWKASIQERELKNKETISNLQMEIKRMSDEIKVNYYLI